MTSPGVGGLLQVNTFQISTESVEAFRKYSEWKCGRFFSLFCVLRPSHLQLTICLSLLLSQILIYIISDSLF